MKNGRCVRLRETSGDAEILAERAALDPKECRLVRYLVTGRPERAAHILPETRASLSLGGDDVIRCSTDGQTVQQTTDRRA